MLVLDKAPCREELPRGEGGAQSMGWAVGQGSGGWVGALLLPPRASKPGVSSAPFSEPGAPAHVRSLS